MRQGAFTLAATVFPFLNPRWRKGTMRQGRGSYTDPKGPGASAAMVRFFFEDTL